MCHQIIMVPKEILEQVLNEVRSKNYVNELPDWPARRINAFPKSLVPIFVPEKGILTIQDKAWGYPAAWSNAPVFNTRADTAMKTDRRNMWRDSLEHRRCIVPTFGFFEPHKSEKTISEKTGKEMKRQYLFTLPDAPFIFMAGIYEEEHFSIMTTDANRWMSPIHDRMPVILRQNELDLWLGDQFEQLFDRGSVGLLATKQ